MLKHASRASYKMFGKSHVPFAYSSGRSCVVCRFLLLWFVCVMCLILCVCEICELGLLESSVVLSSEGLYSVVSLRRRAFVILVIKRPSRACSRISFVFVGWCVTSKDPVGMVSRSGFMSRVGNVV